jgi:hypothetical protein
MLRQKGLYLIDPLYQRAIAQECFALADAVLQTFHAFDDSRHAS